MALRYPKEPPKTVGELSAQTRDLASQLDKIFTVIRDQEVGTTETAIAHGLGFVPKMAHVTPHCLAMVCQTKAPDTKSVYLRASNLCVCDIWVIP